jgi:hypothetical protein
MVLGTPPEHTTRTTMSESTSALDELGPVDHLVVELPPGAQDFSGEMAAELARLSESGAIRILDLLILRTPDGEPGLHHLCEGYQLFFRHVDEPMRVMAGLLRSGRDATGLRGWYARSDATRAGAGPSAATAARTWRSP